MKFNVGDFVQRIDYGKTHLVNGLEVTEAIKFEIVGKSTERNQYKIRSDNFPKEPAAWIDATYADRFWVLSQKGEL